MNFKFPRPRRRTRRLLRHYCHIAERRHGPCGQCRRVIEPGDRYEAYVYVVDGGIVTTKYHDICPWDFWDEEREKDREADKAFEESQKKNVAPPLAA